MSIIEGVILGIVILIIAIIAIVGSGIVSTLFYKITRGFSFIFWILELLLFYGGIVLFIISLIKKTTRRRPLCPTTITDLI